MKKLLLTCALSLACSHAVLASELESKREKDQKADITFQLQKSPSTPYEYLGVRTNALRNQPHLAKHFRGAVGTPGGIDPQFALIVREANENITRHCELLIPYMIQLGQYIAQHGGPFKRQVLAHLQNAIAHRQASPLAYYVAALHGMRPKTIAPDVRDLVEHTIIADDFYYALNSIPKEGVLGLFNEKERGIPDNQGNSFSLRFNYVSYKEYRHNFRKFVQRLAPAVYFGGKFGFTTASELFFSQVGIIGVPEKKYLAHGVKMDPFSAIEHDSAHLEVMEFMPRALKSTIVGLCDHHLALGGTVKGFKNARIPQLLAHEQGRFLHMMRTLNEYAFRLWGGTQAYDMFSVAQFLWWHEYPTGDERMILDPDFLGSMEGFIKAHNRQVNRSDSWESPNDTLQTDPASGKSALTNAAIVEFMLKKYEKQISPHLRQTKDLVQANRAIIEAQNNLDAIERSHSTASQERDEKAEAEKLSKAKEALEKAKADHNRAIHSQIDKQEIISETGNFIDLYLHLNNGKLLKFSETTLRFKARNYGDTHGILKAAGITLPSLDAVVFSDDKDHKRSASTNSLASASASASSNTSAASASGSASVSASASVSNASEKEKKVSHSSGKLSLTREKVMSVLKESTSAWHKLMDTYFQQVKYLAKNIVDPQTGLSLDEIFFRERTNTRKDIFRLLEKDRKDSQAVEFDYRDDASKRRFKGL